MFRKDLDMKVLHISQSDRQGGASIAAFRMMEAMNINGLEARMLVLDKISDTDCVYETESHTITKYVSFVKLKYSFEHHLCQFFLHPKLLFSCGYVHSSSIISNPMVKWADVVYIHWVVGGFLNIEDIGRISKLGKPVFLILHDMWALTGGCHHSLNCQMWRTGCERCYMITRKMFKKVAHWTILRKQRNWNSEDLFVISPSRWLAQCAKDSVLFKGSKIYTIPNMLNDRVFGVMDKKEARQILKLPLNRKLILFGAAGGYRNPFKGWKYADELMRRMGKEADLVAFGGDEVISKDYKLYSIGRMYDESSLAILYNAVDVFISPTQAEAFGLTLMEAICCGVKAVAFNVGGVSDIINHMDNGYLSRPNDVMDLERGVLWALRSPNTLEERKRLHDGIKLKYSYSVVTSMHKKVLNEV